MIEEVINRVCAVCDASARTLYAERLNAMYGPLFLEPSAEAQTLCDEITEIESGFARAGQAPDPIRSGTELFEAYSGLAFALAKESLRTGRIYQVAEPIRYLTEHLYNSSFLSDSDRREQRVRMSETELDLRYAAGHRSVCSIRLSRLMT